MAHILVIDDDSVARRVMAQALAREGHLVVQAGDGRRAWDVFEARVFDAVVCKVGLADRNGLDLIFHFRRAAPDLAIIAVAVETDASDRDLSTAGCLGADGLVERPAEDQTLARAVDRARTLRTAATAPTTGRYSAPIAAALAS